MSGQTDLTLCQEKIGHHFRKIKYLTIALTHSSYANEGKKEDPCNERQEFLGDAVLSIIVSDYLFRHYSHLPEGLRKSLVPVCAFAGTGRLSSLRKRRRSHRRTAAPIDFGRRF